jgi:hypothetical protein
MESKVDKTGAQRAGLLLSLFSPQQARLIIAACASSQHEVSRELADVQGRSGKSLSRALSLTDAVNTQLLYQFLLGLAGAIRADRAQSAISQERAQAIANYLGAPISESAIPKDSVFQHIMEASPEGKAYLQSLSNIKNADKKAAKVIPFYYLLGEQLSRTNGLAQLIDNEMSADIEIGDVNDDINARLIAAREVGDSIESGSPDEMGDASGTAIDLGATALGGAAGFAASRLARAFFRKRKRRRAKAAAAIAAAPAAQEAIATLPPAQQKSIMPEENTDGVTEPTALNEGYNGAQDDDEV